MVMLTESRPAQLPPYTVSSGPRRPPVFHCTCWPIPHTPAGSRSPMALDTVDTRAANPCPLPTFCSSGTRTCSCCCLRCRASPPWTCRGATGWGTPLWRPWGRRPRPRLGTSQPWTCRDAGRWVSVTLLPCTVTVVAVAVAVACMWGLGSSPLAREGHMLASVMVRSRTGLSTVNFGTLPTAYASGAGAKLL